MLPRVTLAIVKVLDGTTHSTLTIKVKFTQNSATLDIANNSQNVIILKPEEMLVLDLRSLGYYKIKYGILQQNLSKYYRFKKADTLCKHFNKFINTLKKEREQGEEPKESYLWLDPADEKYIDLDKSC